ncbi:dopamine receptor 1-like [Patiria miniata]|uniref:G-protein coupled receptors family 1 profile domain-containing protein n=1 Tax=Patiria miniata TaxID=46514 RepID=A0A913Z1A1_PATMI|nr:dopamine receptor 1-like [Patiria miniata]
MQLRSTPPPILEAVETGNWSGGLPNNSMLGDGLGYNLTDGEYSGASGAGYKLQGGSGNDSSSEESVHLTVAETVVIAVVLSTLIVLSIVGNVLVCVAVATEDKLRKTGNSFIVSLAMADLLVSILVMTFGMANDLLGYWAFGPEFCDVWISFDVMFSTASILNICAISVDRYLHIKKPFAYYRWITNRRALVAIVMVWIMSALVSFLPIQLGLHKEFGGPGKSLSTPSPIPDSVLVESNSYICMLDLNPTYAMVSSTISFFLPCVVMIAIYTRIFSAVRERVRNARMGRLGKIDNPDSSCHGNQAASDHKAAVTLGIIMGVFLICWVPFFSLNIIAPLCGGRCDPSPPLLSALTWLGYVNSTLNPIIYSIFNRDFRVAFKRLLGFNFIIKKIQERKAGLLNSNSPRSSIESSVAYTNGRRATTNHHLEPEPTIESPTSMPRVEYIFDRITSC